MRTILIDPKTQTLTEIQIGNRVDEHLAILESQSDSIFRSHILKRMTMVE